MSNRDSQIKNAFCAFTFVVAVVFLFSVGTHILCGIWFKQDCSGHLKRAADANTLELAEKELKLAIDYCKREGLDTEVGRNRGVHDGHTSIIYTTPDEDIGFWYDNLVASHSEVESVIAKGDKASHLERSNVLMKLRETLLDHSDSGTRVTYPQGLDVYPYNLPLALGAGPGMLLLCLCLLVGTAASED